MKSNWLYMDPKLFFISVESNQESGELPHFCTSWKIQKKLKYNRSLSCEIPRCDLRQVRINTKLLASCWNEPYKIQRLASWQCIFHSSGLTKTPWNPYIALFFTRGTLSWKHYRDVLRVDVCFWYFRIHFSWINCFNHFVCVSHSSEQYFD